MEALDVVSTSVDAADLNSSILSFNPAIQGQPFHPVPIVEVEMVEALHPAYGLLNPAEKVVYDAGCRLPVVFVYLLVGQVGVAVPVAV